MGVRLMPFLSPQSESQVASSSSPQLVSLAYRARCACIERFRGRTDERTLFFKFSGCCHLSLSFSRCYLLTWEKCTSRCVGSSFVVRRRSYLGVMFMWRYQLSFQLFLLFLYFLHNDTYPYSVIRTWKIKLKMRSIK